MAVVYRVAAVSPQCVKIHQIDKAKTFKLFFCNLNGLFHTMNRTFGFISLCYTLSVKDILNLSHGNNRITALLQCVKYCISIWF